MNSLKLNVRLLYGLKIAAFYRVNYDFKNWELLKNGYSRGHFPEIVRAQLLDDALFLGRKGILDHEFSLDMMNLLMEHREDQYVVWRPIFRHLKYVQEMMREIDNTKETESNKTSIYFKVGFTWTTYNIFHWVLKITYLKSVL